MKMLEFFETIVNSTFYKGEIELLLNELPNHIKEIFLKNDSQTLRKQLAHKTYFPDARTVANKDLTFQLHI